MAKKTTNIFSDIDLRKLPQHHTPRAEVTMSFLTTPSTEFNEDGVYTVKIRLKAEDKACKKLIKLIEDARKEAYDKATEVLGKKVKMAEPSYKAEEDDDGNETGYVLFNFKRNATYRNKNDELKPIKLPFFDTAGQSLDPKELEIWGGSIVALAFKLKPFYVASLGCGVTHRLEAVQVVKAVSGGNKTAEEYGFECEETDEEDEATEDTAAEDTADSGEEDAGDY